MPAGRRTLIIAIAVMVLVGAGFALTGPLRDTVSPPHGLEVFERSPSPGEQVRADDVAASAGLESEVASSLRSVGRVLGHDFWVFHDELQVCLLSRRDFWFDWVADCATLEAFDKSELKRRISADDIRYGARPPRIGPDEMVVVTWGPESITVDWELEPAPPEGSDPMTYEEWSSARLAARPGEP